MAPESSKTEHSEHGHDDHVCAHDHGEHDGHGHDHAGCNHDNSDSRLVTLSLAVSGGLVGAGLLLQWLHVGPALLAMGVFVAAIFAGGWMLLPGAWAAVRGMRPNISSLMVIAVVGASVIGEWAEAATVVFLFGIAEWLEGADAAHDDAIVVAALREQRVVSLLALDSGFRHLSAADATLAYAESHSAVAHILRTRGEPGLKRLLQ